jgi:protein phosphatase
MFISVETNEHHLYAGDVLVLCSDGLHNSISATDIVQTAGNGSDLNAAARSLVALANQRDGSDNISLQIIRIRDVERVGMYRGRHYKLQ